MNYKIQSLLVPFHFGSIEETERLMVERELLVDSEVLVDYLDLKRKIESAQEVPQKPSPQLWQRLQKNILPKKKLIFSLSLGLALAASAMLCFIFISKTQSRQTRPAVDTEILFDTSHELASSSNVL